MRQVHTSIQLWLLDQSSFTSLQDGPTGGLAQSDNGTLELNLVQFKNCQYSKQRC